MGHKIITFFQNLVNRIQLTDNQKAEFDSELLSFNVSRNKNLTVFFFVLFIFLLFIDYRNYDQGLWLHTPGYRLLFYVHLAVLIGLSISIIFYYAAKLSASETKSIYKKVYVIASAYFFVASAGLCSVIDQYIHGEIIVFIMIALFYAIGLNLKPLASFFMYAIAYSIFIVGISKVQVTYNILHGHYVNGTAMVILAFFLSTVLYYSRVKDFISKKTIERQKTELEHTNAELSAANAELRESLKALDESQDIIFTLALALESKDPNTHGHSERVVSYAFALADYLNLSEKDKMLLHRAAVLHDIGKLGIPDYILNKPLPLTEEEWNVVKLHPVKGEAICSKLKFAQEILPIIRHHHERYDGSGYPDRLSGEDIPFLARIISIADTVDAITSRRSYRVARSMQFALEELQRCAGTQFDPLLAEAFIKIYKNRKQAEV